MKRFTMLTACLGILSAVSAQTPVPGGSVSGIWTASGSPYQIQGDIFIDTTDVLILEPGCIVEFQDNYNLTIFGRILAVGTESDSIIFTAADPEVGFNSISFPDSLSVSDSSLFVYCSIRHGFRHDTVWPYTCGGAIQIAEFDRIRIEHCYFYHNRALDFVPAGFPAGGAIAMIQANILIRNCVFEENTSDFGGALAMYFFSYPVIKDCRFINNQSLNYGGAISVNDGSSPGISGCEFIGNSSGGYGGAIYVCSVSFPMLPNNPVIEYCTFYNNLAGADGGAIELIGLGVSQLINNTLVYNHAYGNAGALDLFAGNDAIIKNCILWGNTANIEGNQVYIWDPDCNPEFYYSDIEGDSSAFGGEFFWGIYENNIDADPWICDTNSHDFHLNLMSPCIDAGDPTCVSHQNGTRCDIGAMDGGYCPFPPGVLECDDEKDNRLQVIPNPAQDNVTVTIEIKEAGPVRIELLNSSGQCFSRSDMGFCHAGTNLVDLDISDLAPGMYFLRVIFSGQVIATKLVIL